MKGEGAGRPEAINEQTLKKLLDAFSYGFTDRESCLYAGISMQTLYNYGKKNPGFLEQKELLKDKPKIKAKMNILEKINNKDIETSKWYLERKAKDEFSLKTINETNLTVKEVNEEDFEI